MDKIGAIKGLYREELLHEAVYEAFSKGEKNAELAKTMRRLVQLERYHAELWGKLLDINGVKRPSTYDAAGKMLTMLCKAVFGIAVTVKAIEHVEERMHQKFNKATLLQPLSDKEKVLVDRVRASEKNEEEKLEGKIVAGSRVFNNIRDIMFGMNDGLVELLAVVVGLAAAIQTPVLTFIAGFIVAVSGTLSMAAGAYLSTGYQKDIDASSARIGTAPSAKSSAFYVGVFYFIGSLFPLSAFGLGIGGMAGIATALVVTSTVLVFTSSLIALASDKSVAKSIGKTLGLSLGAAVVTILLGAYVRSAFHISI